MDWTTLGIIIGIVSAILGALSTIFWLIYSQLLKVKDKEGIAGRKKLINWLRDDGFFSSYKTLLRAFLMKTNQFYGKATSFKAFGRSLTLAYIYPFFAFILAYGFLGGSHEFAGFELFPQSNNYKGLYITLALILALGFGVLLYYSKTLANYLAKRLPLSSNTINLLVFGVVVVSVVVVASVFGLVVVSVFGFVIVSVGGLVVGLGLVGVIVGVVVGVVVGSVVVGLVGVGVIVGVIVVIAVIVVGVFGSVLLEGYQIVLVFLTFLLILPLLNATLDWISWQISRFFLEHASKPETPIWKIMWGIIFDSGFAVIFMVVLVLLLPAVIIVINTIFTQFSPAATIDWMGIAITARDDPWGKGLMVTMMLLTTLIPTLLHITLGLVSLFSHIIGGQRLARLIKQENNLAYIIATLWLMGYAILAIACIFCLWWVIEWLLDFNLAYLLYKLSLFIYKLSLFTV